MTTGEELQSEANESPSPTGAPPTNSSEGVWLWKPGNVSAITKDSAEEEQQEGWILGLFRVDKKGQETYEKSVSLPKVAFLDTGKSEKELRDDNLIEIMVDSGATETVCGPNDFPNIPMDHGPRYSLRQGDGTELPFFGYKTVHGHTENNEAMTIKFMVVGVVRPIASVAKITENSDAEVHFSAKGGSYIERKIKNGKGKGYQTKRLGLVARCGLFFLQLWLAAAAMATGSSGVLAPTVGEEMQVPDGEASQPAGENLIGKDEDEHMFREGEESVTPPPVAKEARKPREPTKQEVEYHELLHMPYTNLVPYLRGKQRKRRPP